MINAILKGIMSLIIGLVSVLLKPIDLAISAALPDISNAFTAVASIFNYASRSIGWAISLTGISSSTISLIILYYTFKLTIPITFATIKLALKWYDKLKP